MTFVVDWALKTNYPCLYWFFFNNFVARNSWLIVCLESQRALLLLYRHWWVPLTTWDLSERPLLQHPGWLPLWLQPWLREQRGRKSLLRWVTRCYWHLCPWKAGWLAGWLAGCRLYLCRYTRVRNMDTKFCTGDVNVFQTLFFWAFMSSTVLILNLCLVQATGKVHNVSIYEHGHVCHA